MGGGKLSGGKLGGKVEKIYLNAFFVLKNRSVSKILTNLSIFCQNVEMRTITQVGGGKLSGGGKVGKKVKKAGKGSSAKAGSIQKFYLLAFF